MQYIYRNDPIKVLSLSRRSLGVLGRAGLKTVGQVLDYPTESFLDLSGIGLKCFSEIVRLRESLVNGNEKDVSLRPDLDRPVSPHGKENLPSFTGSDGLFYRDVLLEDLGLSARPMGALRQYGIRYASELIGATEDDLKAIPRLGARCASEIMSKTSSIEFLPVANAPKKDTSMESRLRELAQEMSDTYGRSILAWKTQIFRFLTEHDDIEYDELIAYLYGEDSVQETLSSLLFQKINTASSPVERNQLISEMPQHLQLATKVVDRALKRMAASGKIEAVGETAYQPKLIHVMDYAQSIVDERQRCILMDRLNGLSLAEAGKRHGNLCRERVRQIESEVLAARPQLFEDKYLYIFDTYYFSQKDFADVFGEPEYVYNYLVIMTRRPGMKSRRLDEALGDKNIPEEMRQNLSRLSHKDCVILCGEPVEPSRLAITDWMIRHCCSDVVTASVLFERYNQLLRDNKLFVKKLMATNLRSFESMLLRQPNLLCGFNHTFRYYDISDMERFRELVAALDFAAYDGLEISSLLLFRKHSDLMQQYDIRNHYELHNLLRKISPLLPEQVKIGRMPTITVGKADRYQQMLNLLLANAPIDMKELAKKYEDLYGGDAKSFISLYSVLFERYNHRGTMQRADIVIPKDRFERLKSLLAKDMYMLRDVQELFCKEFPEASLDELSPSNFRSLGFRMHSAFILKDTYSSFPDYLLKHVPRNKPCAIEDFYSGSKSSSTFQAEFAKLRISHTLIEFSPGMVCHIDYLNSLGVTEEDLKSYCDAVHAFVPADSFFTIFSLRRDGFQHPLDKLGFDDWFYASILQADYTRFRCRRVGNTKYLFHGQKNAISLDFLKSVVPSPFQVSRKIWRRAILEKYGIAITPSFLFHRCETMNEEDETSASHP